MASETNKSVNSDELAFYEIMRDSYKQRYKVRSWIFSKVLKHMLRKIHEESTIFYLLEEVKENRTQ